MNKGVKGSVVILVIVVLLAIFLIWGFIGGQTAKDVGVTCDIGLGDTFCWKWHKNVVGQIGEGIDDLLG